jgi:Diadenosine tetraphosphate (Ap4A) hydrolase and other HIT family hydrolases
MSDTDECVFCEIITGRRDATVLFESEGDVCFLDAYLVNPGHALVIPQHHVQRLGDID